MISPFKWTPLLYYQPMFDILSTSSILSTDHTVCRALSKLVFGGPLRYCWSWDLMLWTHQALLCMMSSRRWAKSPNAWKEPEEEGQRHIGSMKTGHIGSECCKQSAMKLWLHWFQHEYFFILTISLRYGFRNNTASSILNNIFFQYCWKVPKNNNNNKHSFTCIFFSKTHVDPRQVDSGRGSETSGSLYLISYKVFI